MAKRIDLRPGNSPPETEDWVMVERLPSGRHDVTICTAQPGTTPRSSAATFDQIRNFESFDHAMQRAEAEAKRLGIPVYVRGI